MNFAEYAQYVVPEPWTILGLRLRPFSAGHLILLQRVESAFVTGEPVTYDDLAVSVLICANTFEKSVELFSDPDVSRLMRKWQRKIGFVDLEEKSHLFREYLTEACDTPAYIYKEGGEGIGDIPSVQFVKAFLLKHTTLTESEILNRPWRLSILDFLTIQAIDGQLKFTDKEKIEGAQQIASKLAQLVKEGKLRCRS